MVTVTGGIIRFRDGIVMTRYDCEIGSAHNVGLALPDVVLIVVDRLPATWKMMESGLRDAVKGQIRTERK